MHTSTQPRARENVSSSSQLSSIAELELPHAGSTVPNLLSDSSSHTSTLSLISNGQTPPTAYPVISNARSGVSIRALRPNRALNAALSMRASPAATISMQSLSPSNDSVLAMRAASTPAALAAKSTVALDSSNSIMRPSAPNCFR